jgi:hypothetical protein
VATLEQDFLENLMLAFGQRMDLKCWRQNTGQVNTVHRGKITGVFRAGPPTGAADISGIVGPEGWRLEIELKGEKTKVRDPQIAWGKMIYERGGVHTQIRYDEGMTMLENVEAGVRVVERAIEERRRRK